MDGLKTLRASQLQLVHSANLLFYTRERNSHAIARKLKSEFNRVFISSELKDCQRLLSKYHNESTDNKNAIDIVSREHISADNFFFIY